MRNIFAGLRSIRERDRPARIARARRKNFIAAKQEKPRSTTDLVTALVPAHIVRSFTVAATPALPPRGLRVSFMHTDALPREITSRDRSNVFRGDRKETPRRSFISDGVSVASTTLRVAYRARERKKSHFSGPDAAGESNVGRITGHFVVVGPSAKIMHVICPINPFDLSSRV